jgi:hypothetical protein
MTDRPTNQWQAVMKVAWLDTADTEIGTETILDALPADAAEDTDVYSYNYLDRDAVMIKLVGANHSLAPFSGDGRLEAVIKDFLSHPGE